AVVDDGADEASVGGLGVGHEHQVANLGVGNVDVDSIAGCVVDIGGLLVDGATAGDTECQGSHSEGRGNAASNGHACGDHDTNSSVRIMRCFGSRPRETVGT